MPRFERDQPIRTRFPRVEVEAPTRPGRYHFQLVVVNDRGQRSAPARAVVVVRERPGDTDPTPPP
ncbi:hypothetical protein FKZ61_012095 [Litorilinea aerophila]|uniref:Uncharacterized protein n=1 Tax=Litorilinea aerophila TaxID=1204385 RepID=A0A540VFM5_9CHLR|nr:hypothetical protein [Litorilinea aerophila]MCC9076849.1 hypothetical protein [Litorilinea aerophila]OUC08951.1 hypothetical protein RY27_05930 [Litorilinea aerophila]GIV76629.1 MAG: hypothetical protein KatS3mg050_1023 [Litorilinea sp.]